MDYKWSTLAGFGAMEGFKHVQASEDCKNLVP